MKIPAPTLVAAGVILHPVTGDFLLACRAVGKTYAGFWEFPGGKVEPGESVEVALRRELEEELQLRVHDCSPWITRDFLYPHAHVRLHFWRVSDWTGKHLLDNWERINTPDHSRMHWQPKNLSLGVSPVLPANLFVCHALSLPEILCISNAAENGVAAELDRLERAMQQGLRFIQVRDKTLPAASRAEFARAVVQKARHYRALVVINDDVALAKFCGADGVHFSSATLAKCAVRPDFFLVGASCHSAAEIEKAGSLGFDYALLSPVFTTKSHPSVKPLGWEGFVAMRANNALPVFALGGMTPDKLHTAQKHGAHGIAMMRGFFG